MNAPRTSADRPAFHLRLTAVIVVIVAAAMIWLAAPALLVVFIGIMFGVFFSAIAAGLQRSLRIGYRWCVALTMLLLLLVFGLAIVFLSPQVAEQVQMLREEIPKAWSKTQDRLADTTWGQWMLEIGNGSSDWLPQPKALTSGFAGVFATTVGALSGALAAMFIGLFLAVEPGTYVRGVVALFPLHRRARIREVITLLGHVLRRWLLAKFISMAVVGVLTGIGLWLLEVPLAISLAVLASLLTFIPNIGPVIAAIPALLLAFVDGPSKALSVALLYLAVQTVESYGITPFVERETVALRPALTLSAQLALGLLTGFVGVIVATPLTAVCIVIVQTLYIQDVLGDRAQTSLADEK